MLRRRNECAERYLQFLGEVGHREEARLFRLARVARPAAELPVFGEVVQDAGDGAGDLETARRGDLALANQPMKYGRQSVQLIATIASRSHRSDLTRRAKGWRMLVLPPDEGRSDDCAKWQRTTPLLVTLPASGRCKRDVRPQLIADRQGVSGCHSRLLPSPIPSLHRRDYAPRNDAGVRLHLRPCVGHYGLPRAVTDRGDGTCRRCCAIVVPLHLVHGFDHEAELVDKLALQRLRQRVQLIQEPVDGDLVVVELPRGDLLLDPGAEKVRWREAVGGQEALELRQFERADPLSRLERADRLLADARHPGDIFLSEAAHAARFAKFQYEIHENRLLTRRHRHPSLP